jgi:LmbE family N-acetylglucosaminyl deacetylase
LQKGVSLHNCCLFRVGAYTRVIDQKQGGTVHQSPWLCFLSELFGAHFVGSVSGPTLIVAAHPDDETIGASWLLTHAPQPWVVQVTDGAPEEPRLWPAGIAATRAAYAAIRRSESVRALACVRLPETRLVQLGFVDQQAARELAAIVGELAGLLRRLQPSVLVTHPYEGGHPDHDATAVALRAALALQRAAGVATPRVIEMSSYHLHGGAMRTGRFLPHDNAEVVRVLSAEERANKARMFAAYASQRDVLAPFTIEEERYRVAPALSLSSLDSSAVLYDKLGFALTADRFLLLVRAALRSLSVKEEALT